MRKKKILIIAPASYPVTGAEAIVNIKMLKALSDSGKFEIDLVSKRDKWENYQTDNLEKYGIILSNLEIIEVDNKINFITAYQHFLSLIVFGSVFKGSHWAIKALPRIKKMIESNKYDYILTKNSPSLLLGNLLKKKYGFKWIATWNDPYPDNRYPYPYGDGIEAKLTMLDKLQIKIMQRADIHIFPSERLKNYMLKYLNVSHESTVVLPHVVLNRNNKKNINRNKDILKIIHSGNLKSPRNPYNFLVAFSKLVKEYGDISIEITVLGVFDSDMQQSIEELGISQYIKIEKSISYLDSLDYLSNFDIALLIEANCDEGIFLPTKVSDFIECNKNIFAISPKVGTLNDLYNDGYIRYFADVSNVNDIYLELKRMYNDFKNKVLDDSLVKVPDNFKEEYIVEKYLEF